MGGRELWMTRVEKDVMLLVEDTMIPIMQCAAAAAKANSILGQLCSLGSGSHSPSSTCHI